MKISDRIMDKTISGKKTLDKHNILRYNDFINKFMRGVPETL